MDKNLMEFWGNFLIGAAKGQRQWDELTASMKRGLPGLDQFSGIFKPDKGVNKFAEQSAAYLEAWQKAASAMQTAYTDYLKLLGVVPERDYRELARKCEKLKDQLRQQQETIRNLNELLGVRHHLATEATGDFQELIRRQTRQFQDLMDQFTPPKDKK